MTIPGFTNSGSRLGLGGGGFEIVQSVGSYAQRRDEMLSSYRQGLLRKQLHLTDRNQIVGDAELHDGQEMTLELRQRIAAARAGAGYEPTAIGTTPKGSVDLRNNEAYLDGLVDNPDFNAVTQALVDAMGPDRLVGTRELPAPSAEEARQLNTAFEDKARASTEEMEQLMQDYAAAWCGENSLLLSFWPAEAKHLPTTSLDIEFSSGDETVTVTKDLHRITVEATLDIEALNEEGVTVREWFRRKILVDIADQLDRSFNDALCDHCIGLNIRPSDFVEAFRRHTEPLVFAIHSNTLEHWNHERDELLYPDEKFKQLIYDQSTYLGDEFMLARGENAGVHYELNNAFEVDINFIENGKFSIEVDYWHVLEFNPLERKIWYAV